MKRLLPLLSIGLGLTLVATARPASAQDAEKTEKTEKSDKADRPADPDAKDVVELHYPPPAVRWKVLATGVVITAAGWATAFGASRIWPEQNCVLDAIGPYYPGVAPRTPCASGPPGSTQLGIPVVGPWIALGRIARCASDETDCVPGVTTLRVAGYIVDGLVQAAGLGLIIESLIIKTEEPTDSGKKPSLALRTHGIEMRPLPLVSPSMSGLGVVGTF